MKENDPFNRKWGNLNRYLYATRKQTSTIHYNWNGYLYNRWLRILFADKENPHDFEQKFLDYHDSPKIPKPFK